MSVEFFGFDAMIAKLEALKKRTTDAGRANAVSGKKVSVGVLGKGDSTMVVIAASNEYGTSDGHIPSRPFLRTALRHSSLVPFVRRQALAYFRGSQELDKALSLIGIYMTSLIQKQIGSNMPPPNAPATIAKKKSSATLIDTGRLRQSISWEIK